MYLTSITSASRMQHPLLRFLQHAASIAGGWYTFSSCTKSSHVFILPLSSSSPVTSQLQYQHISPIDFSQHHLQVPLLLFTVSHHKYMSCDVKKLRIVPTIKTLRVSLKPLNIHQHTNLQRLHIKTTSYHLVSPPRSLTHLVARLERSVLNVPPPLSSNCHQPSSSY